MEYWFVYDAASGEVMWNGSGASHLVALPDVPDGAKLVVVPLSVLRPGPAVDLPLLRAALAARVDAEAEAVRLRYLTAGAGQAMTYVRKEAEARAIQADAQAAAPFLTAEATARGMTRSALAAEVIAMADQWAQIGSAIEATRMGAKTAIAEAATLGLAVEAAALADWSVFP